MARVLIVDDAMFMRTTLTTMLSNGNHEVVGQAENGEQAVQLYKELLPDIVTMDVTMPVMDGIESVREIVKFDKNAKIIMCSAMGQQKVVVEAIEAGAKDFIVKPFEELRVLETVNRTLSQ